MSKMYALMHLLYFIRLHIFILSLKFHLYLVWGLIAALMFYFEFNVPLVSSVLFGVFVSTVLWIYYLIGGRMSSEGLKMTTSVDTVEEIDSKESRTVRTAQLASLINKNYSEEEIIQKSNEWGIDDSSIRIAIQYQKHPVRSLLVTLLLIGIVMAITYVVIQIV